MKLVMFLLLLISFGCDKAKNLSFSDGEALDSAPIEGEWLAECMTSGSSFLDTTLSFSNSGTLVIDKTFYSAADCEETIYKSSETFDYWFIRKIDSEDEKYAWNYESQNLTYTPGEAQADTWNASGFCDYAEWNTGETVDRTEQDCHGTNQVFDLLKIDGETLYLGKHSGTNDGDDNDSRPVIVDESFGYEKQ